MKGTSSLSRSSRRRPGDAAENVPGRDCRNRSQDGCGWRRRHGDQHRGRRYFIPTSFETHPELSRFYFGDLVQEILLGTLGPDAWLFLAQFTVKCAHTGLKFAWHQDSGYVNFEHHPTINLWCALDDMTEENGTLYILPSSRSGTKVRVEHTTETGSNDRVGYFGDDPGIPLSSLRAASWRFPVLSFIAAARTPRTRTAER